MSESLRWMLLFRDPPRLRPLLAALLMPPLLHREPALGRPGPGPERRAGLGVRLGRQMRVRC